MHVENIFFLNFMYPYKPNIMKKILLLSLLMLASCAGDRWNKPVTCRITGEIKDTEVTEVTLLKAGQSPDRDGIRVPVKDGRFEYTLSTDTLLTYQLWIPYHAGAYYTCDFLPENEGFGFIYMSGSIKTIPRGPLNKALADYTDAGNAIFGSRADSLSALETRMGERLYAPTYVALVMQRNETTDKNRLSALEKEIGRMETTGEWLSEQGRNLQAANNAFREERKAWRREYIAAHPSFPSFSLLVNIIRSEQRSVTQSDLAPWLGLYDRIFTGRFPGHPYHEIVGLARRSLKIAVGGHYIDATLPDTAGRMVKLSDAIGGKVAMIDLWASWCGSCRRRSKEFIPVYKKYKHEGFTVVGIAREFKSDKAWRSALEKDGYPWLNLLEMDDGHKLWEEYGIGNGGGSSYLLDRDGTILAINPTPDEVEAVLETKL